MLDICYGHGCSASVFLRSRKRRLAYYRLSSSSLDALNVPQVKYPWSWLPGALWKPSYTLNPTKWSSRVCDKAGRPGRPSRLGSSIFLQERSPRVWSRWRFVDINTLMSIAYRTAGPQYYSSQFNPFQLVQEALFVLYCIFLLIPITIKWFLV